MQCLCGEGHGNGSWGVDLLKMCVKVVGGINFVETRVSVVDGGASDIREIRFSVTIRIPYIHVLTDLYSMTIESNQLTF